MGPRWYCVHTKPRAEDQVRRNLFVREIEVFNPTVSSRATVRGTTGKEPLFPGYVFARFQLNAHYETVRWAPGVRAIVSNTMGPIVVDDRVIDAVRARFTAQGGWPTRPRPGEAVRVTGGPFKGMHGILELSRSGTERVRLLLNVLHDQVRLELPAVLVRRMA